MTFFLQGQARDDIATSRPPVPTFGERFSAMVTKSRIENDGWSRKKSFEDELTKEIIAGLPEDLRAPLQAPYQPYETPDMRRAAALKAVETWKMRDPAYFTPPPDDGSPRGPVFPSTQEDFDAIVNSRRQAEYDEQIAVLSSAPKGSWGAEFLGGVWADMTDERMLPFLFVGAPARVGLAATVGIEAALGGAGAIATYDKKRSVAEDLKVPAPDLGRDVVAGAMAGGLFAGAIKGIATGAVRFRAYSEVRAAAVAAGRKSIADNGDVAPSPMQSEGRVAETARELVDSGTIPSGQPHWLASQLLDFIGDLEAPKGYDQVFSGSVVVPDRPITSMTLDEVLAWQLASANAGSESTAAGRFQIIRKTLQGLKDELGLSGAELFDGALQNRLGQQLLRRRGLDDYLAGRISAEQFADNLAGEWAALPLVTGPARGQSAHAGVGSNAALTGPDQVLRVLGVEGAYKSRLKGGSGYVGDYLPTSRPYTGAGQVSTGTIRVDVRYEVVDASLLRRAGGELQPRDRSRAASDEQIAEIAANLDPRRLMPAPEADRGAPLVGPDNIVESGNGRVAGIVRAYEIHPDRAAAYRSEIEAFTGQPIAPEIRQPILIARRTSDLTATERVELTRSANSSTIARMSPTEQARMDAGALDADTLSRYALGARIHEPANAGFARAALARMPQSERAALVDGTGALNVEGRRRLRAAVFARAWNAQDIVARFAEAEDDELSSLLQALSDAAPAWAALRAEIEAGRIPVEMDIGGHVVEAMRLIVAARDLAKAEGKQAGGVLAELLDEVDLLDGALSPLTVALVRKFWRDGRAASKVQIADFLTRYATEALRRGNAVADLTGTTSGPADILRAIDRETFGNLPDDIGRPRPSAFRGDTTQTVLTDDLPADAFAKGADGPDVERADRTAIEDLREKATWPAGLADAAAADYAQVLALQQPFDSLEQILPLAEAAQKAFVDVAMDVARTLGVEFKNPGLKRLETLAEKVIRKRYSSPRLLTDVSRGGFIIETPEQAEDLAALLARHFDLVDEGWSRNPQQYVDRKMILRHENGMLTEVQIWTPRMFAAKKAGTPLYDQARSLPFGDPLRSELEERQIQIYSAASDEFASVAFGADGRSMRPKFRAKERANASASAKTLAELATSSSSTGDQPEPGAKSANAETGAPASVVNSTTGRRSQSQNSVFMGNDPSGDTSKMGVARDEVKSLRASLDDLSFRLEDGTEVSASDLLDQIEDEVNLAEVLSLCNPGGQA